MWRNQSTGHSFYPEWFVFLEDTLPLPGTVKKKENAKEKKKLTCAEGPAHSSISIVPANSVCWGRESSRGDIKRIPKVGPITGR